MINKEKYKSLLAQMESGNNYKKTNLIGALGKYQFMPATLNGLKSNYNLPAWNNANYFLNNPALQELYIDTLINDSISFIETNNLNQYSGFTISGSKRFKTITTPINIYGMLAAIHLSGSGNLKRFFRDGYNPDDGLTSLKDYLAYFSKNLSSGLNNFSLLLAFIPAIILYYL